MFLLDDTEIDKFFGECERVRRWPKQENYLFYRRRRTMGIQKDCFAYRLGRCTILTDMVCRHDTCSFYKTKEEMERDSARYGYIKNYKPREDKHAELCAKTKQS